MPTTRLRKHDSPRPLIPLLAAVLSAGCGGARAAHSAAVTNSPDAGGAADSGSAGERDPSVVMLTSGQVRGDMLEDASVLRFLKIPYAKPPLGDLRWKPPEPADSWNGIRHETELSKACAQNKSSGSEASLNEDCLYLNVWQPVPKPDKAPVMVWIHGGGNFAGGSDDKVPTSDQLWFDGKVLADRHGVVVVTFNYRLGALGFFADPQLADEGSNVGNQGLLDQNMVLHWVHDNIAAFGGDPERVTIFGESAGSSDVCFHVASPLSRGLFQRAISESGGCTGGLGVESTAEQFAATLRAFATALGCDSGAGQLACLRSKPIEDIMQNAMQPDPMSADPMAGALHFGVTIDGPTGFLPKPAREIFDVGELNKVPYLLGSNNDEGTLFLIGQSGPSTAAEYTKQLKQRFGDIAGDVEAMYPLDKFGGDAHAALARVIGDSGLVCGTHDSARRAAHAGLTVYMYNFNVPWSVGGGVLGASHASEISHVFGLPYMADAASQRVSEAMNAYWARFAATGDPNGAEAPASWPRFAPDAGDHDQRLQLDPDFNVINDFRRDECAFWRKHYD